MFRSALALTSAVLALAGLASCVEATSSTTSGAGASSSTSTMVTSASSGAGAGAAFDRNLLLQSIADRAVLATLEQFVTDAQALVAATSSHNASPTSATLGNAQQAWRQAMATWQRVELMQVGPAGSAATVTAGQDLRDEVYSWPVTNPCRVDQEITEENYLQVATFAAEPVNVRGLDTLERLLFVDGTQNACPPQNIINQNGAWNTAMPELVARRAAYAAAVSELVLTHATQLQQAWATTGDAFRDQLAKAGQSGAATYPSPQAALNAVSDAMFYIEAVTKDMKVAVPAGLVDCSMPSCPEALEFNVSHFSKNAVGANLDGFELLYFGGSQEDAAATGFDDWLAALGGSHVNTSVIAAIAGCRTALSTIEEDDLALALANDPSSVEGLYFALKALSDVLKTEFITVLDLDLPNSVQGDND